MSNSGLRIVGPAPKGRHRRARHVSAGLKWGIIQSRQGRHVREFISRDDYHESIFCASLNTAHCLHQGIVGQSVDQREA